MLMINRGYYRAIKTAAEGQSFQKVIAINEDQIERQRHMELAVRFLVHVYVPYDGKLDVEEFVDESIVKLAGASDGIEAQQLIDGTFALLDRVDGRDVLRRVQDDHHVGKVGLVGLEVIAVGVGRNLDAILALPAPEDLFGIEYRSFGIMQRRQTSTRLDCEGQLGFNGQSRLAKSGSDREQTLL